MNRSLPYKDINTVVSAHSQEMMALPGVAGIYVGLMPNGKTQCIKVMLKEPNGVTAKKIPRTLEGYPVRTEISGEIKPLK